MVFGTFFNKPIDKYIDIINKKGNDIFIKIMKELQIENYEQYIENPYITLALIHYPKNKGYGISPHTDWGFLTFLYTDQKGLQIKKDNEWIEVVGALRRRFWKTGNAVASRWQVEGRELTRV